MDRIREIVLDELNNLRIPLNLNGDVSLVLPEKVNAVMHDSGESRLVSILPEKRTIRCDVNNDQVVFHYPGLNVVIDSNTKLIFIELADEQFHLRVEAHVENGELILNDPRIYPIFRVLEK